MKMSVLEMENDFFTWYNLIVTNVFVIFSNLDIFFSNNLTYENGVFLNGYPQRVEDLLATPPMSASNLNNKPPLYL